MIVNNPGIHEDDSGPYNTGGLQHGMVRQLVNDVKLEPIAL